MKKIILNIGGMSCSACSSGLEKYLNKQSGILSATVNLVLAQASITYEDFLSVEDLERFVKEAGFESLGIFKDLQQEKKQSKKPLIFYGILLLILLYISMGSMLSLPIFAYLDGEEYPVFHSLAIFLLTLPFLYYGKDLFFSGLKNAIHRTPNMDTLVSLGVFANFGYSLYAFLSILMGQSHFVHHLYFESVAMIIYLLKLGRFIDGRSKEKTKEAIKELVQITPNYALLKTENGEVQVTIDEVKKGDILIAKPGMKIAVDGVIVFGESHLEESFLTGESLPVKKSIKEEVIAGSINIDGYLEYEAKRIGKDSTISEIVRLVVEATNSKAPIGRLADRVSSYFVPFILILAFLTFLGHLFLGMGWTSAFQSMVSVLVVACPCALGLATPLAMVVSVGNCAKKGILMKSSEILEKAYQTDIILFDKTGTLTYGNLRISKVYHKKEWKKEEILSIVASLEAKSAHPISRAFSFYQEEHNLSLRDVHDFENLPGMGIKGKIDGEAIYVGNEKLLKELSFENPYQKEADNLSHDGNSLVYVIKDKEVVALIGVKDVPRKTAKDTISCLQKMNKRIILLTGDNEQTASIIASSLGISEVFANVLPKDKKKLIEDLMKEGKVVMMVGDGINDAPSLATASIGVSVHSGTDIASDSADVILMNDQLEKIPLLLRISKKTVQNIKENLFWAFLYNIAMIPIAMGFFSRFHIQMNPMFASLAMTISSLTVVGNSLRLRNVK